jgi:hypothetical protein
MAVYGLGYNGIKDSGTFKIDPSLATTIATALEAEEGKAYAIDGDGLVGYGTAGDPVFGIVEKVRKEDNNSDVLLASLKLTGFVEGVAITSVTDAAPVPGKAVCVDGSGGVQLADTNAATNLISRARAFSVDTTGKTAIIQL